MMEPLAAALAVALTVRYLAHLRFVRFLVRRGLPPQDVVELARETKPGLSGRNAASR